MRTLLVGLIILVFTNLSYGFGKDAQGCAGDCLSCHKITKEEASEILKNVDPEVRVEKVGIAPAKGLFEVVVKKNETQGVLYLDFSKKYLVLGKIIDIVGKKDVTQERIQKEQRIDVKKIDTRNSVILGNPKGSKKIYVFDDPECPFCKKLHITLSEMIKEDKDLAVYILLFGLDIHPNAKWKSDSILCEAKKNMSSAIEMLENSFNDKEVKKVDCGESLSEFNKNLARKLGIGATPTMVFQNGKVLMGARSKEEIKKYLQNK